MKFTLSWLKDHLDTNASLTDITEALTAIGLEVEDVKDRSAIYAPFKVIHVLEAEKHPNADKLRVCQVQTETGNIQVVCGAPNARAGMKAVYAPEGSVVPANGMVLKKTKIRDVESNGMMVSFREMDLGDDHEGIIDLPADTPIGTTLSSLFGLDDPVIEINVTPNRADCAGIRGIARDLAAKGLGTLKPLKQPSLSTKGATPISVTIDPASSCAHFVGRYIKGVKNQSSPQWLQNRLTAIGLRPISALVDVTNYISYDLCRPLHVFDADKIKGGLTVRLAKQDEEFHALNDKPYKLPNFVTVISDSESVESIGGIMGGMRTSCTDETTNVFLEVAYFDAYQTAKGGRALQINSDARYRFERGVDPAFTRPASDIATAMILELCGGEAFDVVEAGAALNTAKTVSYDPALATKILGFDIDAKTQAQYLTAIGCNVDNDKTPWTVTAPTFRHDITMPHDLVEEVARLNGFDTIPPVSVTRNSAIVQIAETARGTKIRQARSILASRGLNETVTWSFMDEAQATFFAPVNYPANGLKISNPISNDLGQMRPSILPNLINAAQRNTDKGLGATALFEIGPVFHGTDPDQQPVVATALRVLSGEKHWSGNEASRAVDIFDIKADMLAVLGSSFANAPITREAPAYYHPGRSGAVRLGNKIVAYFGEIHPAVLDAMKIDVAPVVAFEIFVDAIPDAKKKGSAKPMLELSSFQPVTRDFAFVCPRGLESDQIVKTIRGVDRALITKAAVFDIYEGKGVADGHKSVAVAVTLQPMAQSLTDSDIEGVCQKIINAVQSKTGATLR